MKSKDFYTPEEVARIVQTYKNYTREHISGGIAIPQEVLDFQEKKLKSEVPVNVRNAVSKLETSMS